MTQENFSQNPSCTIEQNIEDDAVDFATNYLCSTTRMTGFMTRQQQSAGP